MSSARGVAAFTPAGQGGSGAPEGSEGLQLQSHGAELVGEVVQYEDMYLLCYVRGPEGIMVALAEPPS